MIRADAVAAVLRPWLGAAFIAGCDICERAAVLMSGFDSGDIDMLIKSLRKYGVGRVALKAIVTETNINWSSIDLYEAIKADHEEMQRRTQG